MLAPQAGTPPTPQRRLAELQAQADFDRALIVARTTQDVARTQTLKRADTLIAAGNCADAETLVREKTPDDLAAVASRCAAPRK